MISKEYGPMPGKVVSQVGIYGELTQTTHKDQDIFMLKV
jgi:hypothetical protein